MWKTMISDLKYVFFLLASKGYDHVNKYIYYYISRALNYMYIYIYFLFENIWGEVLLSSIYSSSFSTLSRDLTDVTTNFPSGEQ